MEHPRALSAVLLAAGVGRRLGHDEPKCLLRFGGRTLLARHVVQLEQAGVERLCIAVGHGAERIARELATLRTRLAIETVPNPRYERGSVVTLHAVADWLRRGEDLLLMDADVLYDARMLQRLQHSAHPSCFLLDRDFEPGDEPVKLCVRGGELVEFRKRVGGTFDLCGESVGFFLLDAQAAVALADAVARYVAAGRLDDPYEEPLRDVLLAAPERFGYEDVTGLPWVEIDFPEDVRRAREEILPRLADVAGA